MENQTYLSPGDGTGEEMKGIGLDQRINQLRGEVPLLASLNAEGLSLLKQMITVPEQFRKQQIFLLAEFMDGEEALDHVAAYYEAEELGMTTDFNVAYMLALAATNRKENSRYNRVAAILGSLSSFRYTTNQPKSEKHDSGDRRGPLN